MLPDLLVPLADQFQAFNLFRYITFRTGGATITALIISLLCGPAFIRWLKTHQAEGQPIRDDGPESHLINKIGTPPDDRDDWKDVSNKFEKHFSEKPGKGS